MEASFSAYCVCIGSFYELNLHSLTNLMIDNNVLVTKKGFKFYYLEPLILSS